MHAAVHIANAEIIEIAKRNRFAVVPVAIRKMATLFRPIALVAGTLLAGCAQLETRSGDQFSESGELIALSGGGREPPTPASPAMDCAAKAMAEVLPRLASLDAGYLQRQLEAFADGRRRHPQMSWIAKHLSTRERLEVSRFYSAMPFETSGTAILPAPGLFVRGDRERGIAACASCHGQAGEGIGPANPPLAGQPASYLEAQIDSWRRSDRRNDPGDVMLRISQLLTPAESAALSAYASRLPGRPRSPESPEASREARRVDPRSGASALPLHVPESARAGE